MKVKKTPKKKNNTSSSTKGNPENSKLKSKMKIKILTAKPIPKYFTFILRQHIRHNGFSGGFVAQAFFIRMMGLSFLINFVDTWELIMCGSLYSILCNIMMWQVGIGGCKSEVSVVCLLELIMCFNAKQTTSIYIYIYIYIYVCMYVY